MGAITGGNNLYLNVSSGKIVNKKKELSMFGYEGTLIGIRRKEDEYEGKPIQKIELKMKDSQSEEIALISFTEESWYAQGFFARINSIDLKRPFVLGVSGSDQNEKVSFCWLKQGADTIKSEKGSFPAPTKTSRGKTSYDDMLDAIDPILQKLVAYFEQNTPQESSNRMQPNQNAGGGFEKDPKKTYGTVRENGDMQDTPFPTEEDGEPLPF